jgi:hypothetical protein
MAFARSDRQSHLAHTHLFGSQFPLETGRPERIDQEHGQQVEQHRRRSRIVVMDTRERERAVADRLAPGRWGDVDLERVRADGAALTFSDAAQGPRSLTIATRGHMRETPEQFCSSIERRNDLVKAILR